jgi:hypothetical protein
MSSSTTSTTASGANPSLALVKLKGNAKKQQLKMNLINDIKQYITTNIPNFADLKRDLSLIETCCNLCENSKVPAENKEECVTTALIQLIPELNNEQDLKFIKASIQYIVSSGLVNKIPNSAKIYRSLTSWVKKKVL